MMLTFKAFEQYYKNQSLITFLRQLIEKNGYWHLVQKYWIELENIQFSSLGACNPPTDAGRVVLTPRYVNLCPLILVEGLLKVTPPIYNKADGVAGTRVDVHQNSSIRFHRQPVALHLRISHPGRALEFLEILWLWATRRCACSAT